MSLSHNLLSENHTICCAACGHKLSATSSNWKLAANLQAEALHELGTPYSSGDGVLLRKFYCPGCGLLLDTELAISEDDFLEDRLFD